MTSEEFDAHSREMSKAIARLRVLNRAGLLAAVVMLLSSVCGWPWPFRISCGVTLACQWAHLWLGRRIGKKQRRVMDALLADIEQMHSDVSGRLIKEN
jgi:hypothetical protein